MVRRTIKSGFWKNRFLAFWCPFKVCHPNLSIKKRQMFNYGSLMSRRTVWATQNSNQFCSGHSVNLRKWSNVTLVFHVFAIHGIDRSQYYAVSVVGWLVSLRSLPFTLERKKRSKEVFAWNHPGLKKIENPSVKSGVRGWRKNVRFFLSRSVDAKHIYLL